MEINMSSKNNQIHLPEVTWAQATRDVIRHFIDKGLLLSLIFCGIIFMFLFKSSTEAMDRVLLNFFECLKRLELWSYILLPLAIIFWNRHVAWIRNENEKEMKRIGDEKTKMQNAIAKKDFKSSKK